MQGPFLAKTFKEDGPFKEAAQKSADRYLPVFEKVFFLISPDKLSPNLCFESNFRLLDDAISLLARNRNYLP